MTSQFYKDILDIETDLIQRGHKVLTKTKNETLQVPTYLKEPGTCRKRKRGSHVFHWITLSWSDELILVGVACSKTTQLLRYQSLPALIVTAVLIRILEAMFTFAVN